MLKFPIVLAAEEEEDEDEALTYDDDDDSEVEDGSETNSDFQIMEVGAKTTFLLGGCSRFGRAVRF